MRALTLITFVLSALAAPATGQNPPLGLVDFDMTGDVDWSETGGVIMADNGVLGSLVTKGTYGDFELTLEFQAERPSPRPSAGRSPAQLLQDLQRDLDDRRPGGRSLGTRLRILVACADRNSSPNTSWEQVFRAEPQGPQPGESLFTLGVGACTDPGLSTFTEEGPFSVVPRSWHEFTVRVRRSQVTAELDGRPIGIGRNNLRTRTGRVSLEYASGRSASRDPGVLRIRNIRFSGR